MKCSTVVVPVAGQREGPDTTPEEFLEGLRMAEERIPEGTRLEGAFVRREILKEVEGKTSVQLLPVELNLAYEWTDSE